MSIERDAPPRRPAGLTCVVVAATVCLCVCQPLSAQVVEEYAPPRANCCLLKIVLPAAIAMDWPPSTS